MQIISQLICKTLFIKNIVLSPPKHTHTHTQQSDTVHQQIILILTGKFTQMIKHLMLGIKISHKRKDARRV